MKKWNLLGNNAQFIHFPFETFLHAVGENVITEIDLTVHAPHFYIDSDGFADVCHVKEKMREAGVAVSCITPLPYRFNICADAGTIQREKTLAYYKQCILAADYFGAPYATITASGACYDYASARLRSNAYDTLKELADFAKAHDVVLLLGTVVGEECPANASTPVFVTLGEVKEALTQVGSAHLKAYLDTEAISLCGETITEWFDLLGEEIALIRFTDGNYNGYRVWGEGCLPCKKFLMEIEACGYGGDFSLNIPGERYTADPEKAMKENLCVLREAVRQVREDGNC